MRILICLLFSIAAVDFATAGCDINLRVKNETKYAIEFSKASPTRSKSFQVKTRGVPWRNVDKGGWDTDTWADAHRVVGLSEEETVELVGQPSAVAWTLLAPVFRLGPIGVVTKTNTAEQLSATNSQDIDLPSVLDPGKTAAGRYEAVLGCGVKRRYRIDFTCHEITYDAQSAGHTVAAFTDRDVAHKTRYFPGPEQWAEGRNVTIPIKSCK
tara:strand:- start:46 stop:681 length:636 start_codon:yes stop_codon:yes gene_type:complete